MKNEQFCEMLRHVRIFEPVFIFTERETQLEGDGGAQLRCLAAPTRSHPAGGCGKSIEPTTPQNSMRQTGDKPRPNIIQDTTPLTPKHQNFSFNNKYLMDLYRWV